MRAVMEARGVAAHAEVHPIMGRATSVNTPIAAQLGPQRLAM
jgi:hypothetical protein